MSQVIILDTGPLGLITNPKLSTESIACAQWLQTHVTAGNRWAQARQQGQPTAGDKTIDGDMILVAQAMTFAVQNVVIATTNVGHLSRFVAAELWQSIPPG